MYALTEIHTSHFLSIHFFSIPESHPGCVHVVIMSPPGSCWWLAVSQTWFILMPLNILKTTGLTSILWMLWFGIYQCCHQPELKIWDIGRNQKQWDRVPFSSTSYQGYILPVWFSTADIDLMTWLRWYLWGSPQ